MMGRLNHDQGELFYSFCLEEVVPDDHLIREIAAVLDLSWVRAELAHYPNNGRPSIDPELMIRMLIIGYVLAIRSERALCRDVQVNLAYRWFLRASKPIERTRPSKKINSLFSVLRQRLALSQACLLHAHILPAMTSACCLKATTSTPICRSPCRRYLCGSLAGHN
jgi:Transposase domain (DUF772)